MRNLLLFIILCGNMALVHAQGQVSPRAQRLFSKAQECLKKHDDEGAELNFQKCIREAPQYADAYIALGTLYCDNRRYTKAADVFKQASLSCPACTQVFGIQTPAFTKCIHI